MRFKIFQILIFVCIVTVSSNLFAQQGIGTDTPNKSAALEIRSSSKGLLIPRVILESTEDDTIIVSEDVESLLVFNTNTQNDVIPGYYYWSIEDGGKWKRLLVEGDELNIENENSWYVQGTIEPATDNDQNIYQAGNVAIGKAEGFLGATLDVAGTIRGGNPAGGTFGENSIAVGDGVIASGKNSMAIGYTSEATEEGSFAGGGYYFEAPPGGFGTSGHREGGKASGKNSFAFGYEAEARGELSTAFGYKTLADSSYTFAAGRETQALKTGAVAFGRETKADGSYSVALGRSTRAVGNYSFASGRNTEVTGHYGAAHGSYLLVNSSYLTAVGRGNVNFGGSVLAWDQNDPLFVIGNGENRSITNNAMTVLKSGFVGIGLNGTGATAKPKERLDIGNGKVRIRDLPDLDNQGDPNEDRIVVVRTSTTNNQKGILRSISPSELKSTGPWFIQSTINPATLNDQDIFQTGSVAIGKNKVLTAGDGSSATLDVKGAIRGGSMTGTTTTPIGENSIGVGYEIRASGANSAAFGYKSEATGAGSFAGGGDNETGAGHLGGKASGLSSFAYGWSSKAIGDYSFAFGRSNEASGLGSFALGRESEALGNYSFAMGNSISNDITTAIENNSFAFGRGAEALGERSFAFGERAQASGIESFAFGQRVKALGNRSFAFGLGASSNLTEALGKSSFAFGNEVQADGEYSFAFGLKVKSSNNHEFVFGKYNALQDDSDSYFQIANGTHNQGKNLLTILENGKVGIGLFEDGTAAKPTEILDIGEGRVKIRDLYLDNIVNDYKIVVVEDDGVLKSINISNLPEGKVFLPAGNASLGDSEGVAKKTNSVMPKFFPMSAVMMPLSENAAMEYDYHYGNGIYTVNLHQIFRDQYEMSGSNNISSEPNHRIPSFDADKLIYNITYYDEDVFTNLSLNPKGELSYKINAEAASNSKTYMNIVFEVKD